MAELKMDGSGGLSQTKAKPSIKLAHSQVTAAETPDATAEPGVSPAIPRKRIPIDRGSLRLTSKWLDAVFAVIISLIGLTFTGTGPLDATVRTAIPFVLMAPIMIWMLHQTGAYRFPYSEPALDHLGRTALGASLTLCGIIVLTALLPVGTSGYVIPATALAMWLAMMGLHGNYIALIKALIRSGQLSDNVVIVGATNNAKRLIQRNQENRELNILGVFDDRAARAPKDLGDVPVLGGIEDLLKWDRLPEVDRIIVTVTSTAQTRVREMIDRLRYLPNRVVLLLDLDGFNPESTSLAQIADAPAAYVSGAPRDARRAAFKRGFDVIVGTAMLIGFGPLMAVVAALIKLDSKGPVFFRQKRHGFNNQIIRVWKFRTMRPDKDAEEGIIRQVTAGDDRVTKIGKFLRATSLDELPQLFNVLKGEMSLVGPRPHAVGMTTEEVAVHSLVAEYAHRHRVKPGLTGWAQINGSRGPVHSAEEVRERVRLDMEYVNRSGVWFDFYVCIMTAPCLLGDVRRDR
jgi:Undecaprenyl-phosphate glucose phosphotransferase